MSMVSALIPTFNRRALVGRAIDSVLSQSLAVDEIIVVDDGSTDGTAESIERRYGPHVRVVRQENQGVSSARCRAIREAKHEWVAFLDSDDEWTSDRNRLLTIAATACPLEVSWVFGNTRLVQDDDDNDTLFHKFGLAIYRDPHIFEDSMAVQFPFQFGLLQASLIRRSALLEVDAFSAGLQHSEDFLAGVQIACRYKFAAIDAIVCRLYRTSELKASSLDLAGRASPDYCLARMIAFSTVLASRRAGPWAEEYAEAVRGLCKIRARQKQNFTALAFKQFRYGISAKSLAFAMAAIFGEAGLRGWSKLGHLSRRIGAEEKDKSLSLGWLS